MTDDVHVTGFAGDAAEYVRQNAGGHDMVVCIGGDGTLNEVITGLVPAAGIFRSDISLREAQTILPAVWAFPRTLWRRRGEYCAARRNRMISEGSTTDIFRMWLPSGRLLRYPMTLPQALKNSFGHFAYVMESIKELPDIKPIPRENHG